MSKELVIGSNRHETKVAVLEEDQLVEVYFQRKNEYSLAGSVHKGRVTRVLPGMQSAFVDLGLERDTFLYVSDFFEENEDIDTVEEKPLRSERRDRGPNRNFERPSAETAEETSSEPVETANPEMEEASEEESGAHASELQAVSTAEPAGAAEKPEGDRGPRGERRGRRSRRRRQRGRGFPENKYAQPASVEALPEEAEAVAAEPQEEEVIVLPGESLAKYRNVAPGSERASRLDAPINGPTSPAHQPAETAPDTTAEGSSEEESEELEAEAEELELADKIFAHNDNESPEEVEEKIDEVKQDQPGPAPGAETQSARETEPETFHEPAAKVIEISSLSLHETALNEECEDEAEANEFELEAADEGLPEVDETLEDNALPISDRRVEETPGTSAATGEERSPTQTASVREQGGRYMHRMSRRMRRRRGGNRFGQQQETGTDSAGLGTGAAVAMEPQARAEVQRESVEERSSSEKPDRVLPSISDLLKEGQEIIVQIAKEPLGQKGARITSHIALPGRYVVYMPTRRAHRRFAQDRQRRRAPAPEAHSADAPRRHPWAASSCAPRAKAAPKKKSPPT